MKLIKPHFKPWVSERKVEMLMGSDCQDMDGGWLGVVVMGAGRPNMPLSAVANI